MKASRDSQQFAERLRAAAQAPLVQPAPSAVVPAASNSAPAPAAPVEPAVRKSEADLTRQITLRPKVAMWARYINAAAERSKVEGRTVSPQEIALEILEKANV